METVLLDVLPKFIIAFKGLPQDQILFAFCFCLSSSAIYWGLRYCCRKSQPNVAPDGNGDDRDHKGLIIVLSLLLGGVVSYAPYKWYFPSDASPNSTHSESVAPPTVLPEQRLPEATLMSATPDQSSSRGHTPSPSPLSTVNTDNCCNMRMNLPYFQVIKYGTSELKLVDLLSNDWVSFWMTVGFTLPQLKAQVQPIDSDADKERKLYNILDKWIQGKFNKQGHRPTYKVLVKLLEEIELHDLVRDFREVFKGKMADKVNYMTLQFIDHHDKQVRLIEKLKDYWVEFGMVIGYSVTTTTGNRDSFIHFCTEWLHQRLPTKRSRQRYPNTFEGFRQILIDNDKYVEDFTTAVEQAGICKFST